MFLSRLFPDPRNRAARRDLADVQQLHRTLMSAFPDVDGPARESLGVLHRVEAAGTGVVVLVQSRARPEWSQLPEGYLLPGTTPTSKDVGGVLDELSTGQRLRFRLVANATRRLRTDAGGKRVPLRDDGDRVRWIVRQGEASGFRILPMAGTDLPDLEVRGLPPVHGRAKSEGPVVLEGTRFDGRLEVTDAVLFRDAIRRGLGRGKAYGFGMLSIAPDAALG